MKLNSNRLFATLVAIGTVAILTGKALAGGHTWRIGEVFTDSTGTIQFVECQECCGGANESATAGHNVTGLALSRSFTITANSAAPTSFKTILLGTPAFATLFAALPGSPTPNYIIPPGSVPFVRVIGGDTITYVPYHSLVIPNGALPTDGVKSYYMNGTTSCNTPKNYAGLGGTINAGCTLQGDVNNDSKVDGDDVGAFVRAKMSLSLVGESPACAEYCTGSLATDITAFVNDLLI
jgi:hypothetical protein